MTLVACLVAAEWQACIRYVQFAGATVAHIPPSQVIPSLREFLCHEHQSKLHTPSTSPVDQRQPLGTMAFRQLIPVLGIIEIMELD